MEDDEPFELENAWAALQHVVALMLAIFGGAAALAERLILTRATRIEILQWLAPLEAVARRLLLIEALKLMPPNAPPPQAYARRIAMRVHHAIPRARKVFAPYRHGARPVETLLRRVQVQADLALAALNTS